MDLNNLLQQDGDAAAYYRGLPEKVRSDLHRCGGNIGSLAALREYAANLSAQVEPNIRPAEQESGVPLDPELAAEWVMEHQV